MLQMVSRWLIGGLFLAMAGAAHASTVTLTFDGVANPCGVCPPDFPESVVESGYTISGYPGHPGFSGSGYVHLDDGGSPFSDFVSFTGPSRFNVVQLDLFGLGSELLTPVDPMATDYTRTPYLNVVFKGFRDGGIVAQTFFSTGATPQSFLGLTLGNLFTNLDKFVISVVSPALAPGQFCSDYPCGHVNVDNVVLASVVPLPATVAMMGGALALMGMFGMRRRRHHA